MSERHENSLQTAARWGRNAAIGAVAAGAALNLVTSIAEPIIRNRERFRRNRDHGTTPVDRETSEENIRLLESRVAEFKQRLASGEDLLDLFSEDSYLEIQGFDPATHTNNSASIESLLDKARVPTMNPKQYHEIETWWDEVYAQAQSLEKEALRREDEEEGKALEEGIWSEGQPKWLKRLESKPVPFAKKLDEAFRFHPGDLKKFVLWLGGAALAVILFAVLCKILGLLN